MANEPQKGQSTTTTGFPFVAPSGKAQFSNDLASVVPAGEIYPSREARPRTAILGGTPAFETPLFVGRPNMPDHQGFLTRMNKVLSSGQLTNWGPMVREFESRVAEVAGAKHCIATNNATTGLELAISGLDMSGDVIVPSFTFIATVHALWRQGVRRCSVTLIPTPIAWMWSM